MTCEHIREDLVETARARELSSDVRAMVFAHTARCPDCEMRLAREIELSRALGALAMTAESSPARIEQFLRRHLPTPIRTRTRRWPQIATAAAALVAAILLVSTGVTHRETPPTKIVGTVAPQPSPASHLPDVSLASRQTANTVDRSQSRPIARQRKRAPLRTAPEMDEFIALPYAATLLDNESSELVRVRMSREALLSVGLPVNADQLSDEIQADVVLGMDGTPRAIRLAN